MQPNTITLAVDLLNNGTPTDVVFRRHEELVNRSTYVGPAHSAVQNDMMQLYRTPAKRSGNFLGTNKVSVKFTETVTVKDAAGLDIPAQDIDEVSFSLPVGVTAAQSKARRQKLIAILDNDSVMDTFMGILEI